MEKGWTCYQSTRRFVTTLPQHSAKTLWHKSVLKRYLRTFPQIYFPSCMYGGRPRVTKPPYRVGRSRGCRRLPLAKLELETREQPLRFVIVKSFHFSSITLKPVPRKSFVQGS